MARLSGRISPMERGSVAGDDGLLLSMEIDEIVTSLTARRPEFSIGMANATEPSPHTEYATGPMRSFDPLRAFSLPAED
jgi:hypothetical protein